jgi:hypothetical protein
MSPQHQFLDPCGKVLQALQLDVCLSVLHLLLPKPPDSLL